MLRACIADADGHSIWESSSASYIEERVVHGLSQLLRHVAETWCQDRGTASARASRTNIRWYCVDKLTLTVCVPW